MKVVVDYVELRKLLAKAFDKGIDCPNCPYYSKCDGSEDSEECAELFIDQIAEEMFREK